MKFREAWIGDSLYKWNDEIFLCIWSLGHGNRKIAAFHDFSKIPDELLTANRWYKEEYEYGVSLKIEIDILKVTTFKNIIARWNSKKCE